MTKLHTLFEERLLQNGSVLLYFNPLILKQDLAELAAAGWQCDQVSAPNACTQDEFYDQISVALGFPDYFGRNVNALKDCLGDLDFPQSGRRVFTFEQFDRLAHSDRGFAHAILDVFARAERRFLLEGKRILVLVQSNDPKLNFAPVGSTGVLWNPKEWFDARRKK